MEEVNIWQKVIQWGIAQHNTLPQSLKVWTKENFLTLKTTLQNCLPHIRYFQLSNEDLWKNVKPYKKILDKKLWNDIKQHMILPGEPITSVILPARSLISTELPKRVDEIFSTIISREHTAEVSAWIDHKNQPYPIINIPYEFDLILRGSRDGFNHQTFWNMCHGHSKTIVVLKVQGTDEILGGYNPLAWDKTANITTWAVTNNSFIFSLKNGNIQNSTLSRVNKPNEAILNVDVLHQYDFGPYFGCKDLYMSVKKCFCQGPSSYETSIREAIGAFPIVDYEVFKIKFKSAEDT
ncbi:10828_t:CDS:1 [Acaulospora colombiana]|uniref:10828_t:CDS:1 n=1 Tax=Acaulospora colombiana TaxID=27376 RepID=A0ACA9KBJ9_9GLOM|nr:10828_t:CDS:1 [Acaulospora colombiana]